MHTGYDFLWYYICMIDSLRKISSSVFVISLLAVGVSVVSSYTLCVDASCSASVLLSQNGMSVPDQSMVIMGGIAIWAVFMYSLGLSAAVFLMLELIKPKFLKRYIKRSRRSR